MLTLPVLILVGAFILALVNAAGKCPLWPSVILVVIHLLMGAL